jgi:hypothetical protein
MWLAAFAARHCRNILASGESKSGYQPVVKMADDRTE